MGLNKLKDMFAEGRAALGTFLGIANMSFVECLGYTGLDFVIIDGEHGPWDTETVQDLIRAAELVKLAPVVRIATVDHREIQRAVDCGAEALIIPCLHSVEEFREAVSWAKYPPLGNRGFIKGRGTRFGNADWADTETLDEYLSNANERVMVMPQCETLEALEHIEEIVGIEGVDAIFIGPFDLSISMGMPGRFDDPEFLAAEERILSACHRAGKPCYIYSGSTRDSRAFLEKGYDGIAHDIDFNIITKAFKDIVEEIR